MSDVTPDLKKVREIARSAFGYLPHDYVRARLVQAAIVEHGIDEHDIPTWSAYFDAATADLAGAVVSWPDEWSQNGRDGYAVRLLDMLEADPDRFQESEEEDLRAALSALFRCTAEAANLATALSEAQAERDGATQAVAEAVSILEGMLNEDTWAYDAGRARNVLLDYFARDLDALEAGDAKGGKEPRMCTCGELRTVCQLRTEVDRLSGQLKNEREALAAERDEARELACVSLDILKNVSDEPMRELYGVDDFGEMPAWFTGYGKPSGALEARDTKAGE